MSENEIVDLSFKLNHQFQEVDNRDYSFEVIATAPHQAVITKKNTPKTIPVVIPPPTYSLKVNLTSIVNQGNLGSCVSNAFSLNISTQTKNNVNISRLQHYGLCRILDNTPFNQDNGTTIRTACKALLNYGACQETEWPYITSNFNTLSPLSTFKNSKKFYTFTYTFISQNLTSLKTAITTYKTPIIFGFLVYSSFMTNVVSSTGVVPMPNKNTEKLQGGHCMCVVGFDDIKEVFICANSWGTNWGDKGLCYMPYAYLTNSSFAADFCVTTFVY